MPPIQPIQRPIEPARRFPLALLLLLLLIVIAAIVLIPRFITQAPPAPTTNAVAVVATDLATVSSVATSLATDVPTQDLNGQATNILATATGMAAQVQTGIATSMINATALTEVAALPTNATAVSTSALAATGTVTGVTTQSTTGGSLDTLIAALPAQLSAAGIPTATVAVKDSSLGKALTISYCQPFGPNMQKNAYSAMDVLAAQVASFAGQADALAIEVHGCGAAAPIEYRALVPVAQAVAYTSKQIDVHQFRASWRTN